MPEIKDKDHTSEAVAIFFMIITPIIVAYILVTCFCRYRRKIRKETERKTRAEKYRQRVDTPRKSAPPLGSETVATEQNMVTEGAGEGRLTTRGPFDDEEK